MLNLATGGAYYLNNLYLSLFSFWGSAYLAAKLGEVLPKHRLAAVIAFLFFPSVLFWSSGVMKDPVMYGSMCWLTGAALALAHGQKPGLGQVLLLPLQLYLFIRIKVFYAALLLPLLLAYVLVQRLKAHVHVLRSLKAQLLLLLALAGGRCCFSCCKKRPLTPILYFGTSKTATAVCFGALRTGPTLIWACSGQPCQVWRRTTRRLH